MTDLTNKQEQALGYIGSCLEEQGTPPTLRELCEFMGYKAVGSAQDMIAALRRKGYLQTPDRQKSRALLLSAKGRLAFLREFSDKAEVWEVPCLGSVPAGHPLEAIEEQTNTLRVAPEELRHAKVQPEKLYALRADGESMVGAGILDGDWLIVHAQEEANAGDIVVARVEHDVTVKRLMKGQNGDGWFLQPENPNFQPICARDKPMQVIGRVVGVQRYLH